MGNLEGGDIASGLADVIVTDGFTGNVVVKTMEGMAEFVQAQIRKAVTSRPWYLPAAAVLLPAFKRLRRSMDYREYGAGPLLGVNGLVFIGHGRSDARAVASALRVAREAVASGMLAALREAALAQR
jgi:glycerol-3-phosphate acyltransferase PlsX